MLTLREVLATGLLSCTLSQSALASDFLSNFIDAEDGWLDSSDWVLQNAAGFMPVPIVITEPAVGEGLGLAALFFHPPDDYDPDADQSLEQSEFVLPDVSAVAAGYTRNGTWFVGGGHLGHWRDDRVRYQGYGGYADIRMKFFGLPGGVGLVGGGVKFRSQGALIDQQLLFRWGQSDFFIGGKYAYSTVDTAPDGGVVPPSLDLTMEADLSSLGLVLNYDSRDNIFTPNSGLDSTLKLARNDQAIGSDFDFTQLDFDLKYYKPIGPDWVIGARLNSSNVNGDIPFYAVPFIKMRGIPALRYQGEHIALAETEIRWDFHRRVSLTAFVGAGRAAKTHDDLSSAPSRVSRGLGLRYLTARKLGMYAGIDIARGPEDTHYYLTVGNSW